MYCTAVADAVQKHVCGSFHLSRSLVNSLHCRGLRFNMSVGQFTFLIVLHRASMHWCGSRCLKHAGGLFWPSHSLEALPTTVLACSFGACFTWAPCTMRRWWHIAQHASSASQPATKQTDIGPLHYVSFVTPSVACILCFTAKQYGSSAFERAINHNDLH